jgi:asparagine synthase (glutamine-hydrolysing)
MCGILGIVHREAKARPGLSDQLVANLAHRGPDDWGTYTDDYVQLGHTRLSILDLSAAGHQPMLGEHERYVVTYNGEIYNYLELRAELEALGSSFKSHSDTEVLLAAYHVWGRACVERFVGMFAFVIWDKQAQVAFIARDRCGEKPLFYQFTNERLTFASELKGLLPLLDERPDLDPVVVDQYLHYQYVPEPNTLLKGIHKLAAGHTLTIALADWHVKPKMYWCVETAASLNKSAITVAPKQSQTEALAEIRVAIETAVKMTLRADVPVGVALSGGIDSGAIASLAQKNNPQTMHAFCVGYPGRPHYDEREQARTLATSLGMIVHEVELPVDSFVDFFPALVSIMDEPIADPAAFGHYSVPKAAADQGIKVLLSGVGGDELFWGYPYVTEAVKLNQLAVDHSVLVSFARWFGSPAAQAFLIKVAHYPHIRPEIRRAADILQKLGDQRQPTDQLLYYLLHPDFSGVHPFTADIYGEAMHGATQQGLFEPTKHSKCEREKIPAAIIGLLFKTWLTSNCLSLSDRVGMAVGVETRMPFLDANLIAKVMSLRAIEPDHALGQKAWLRAAMKGVLPDEVLSRPKAGFQPPVQQWLSGVISKYGDALREGHLVEAGFIRSDKVQQLLSKTVSQGWHGLFFTYKLVLLELWYQRIVSV